MNFEYLESEFKMLPEEEIEKEMVTAMENLADIVNDDGGISDKSYISDIVT